MMLKKYFSKDRTAIDKSNMIQSIVGIGDILEFEMDRNNNSRILSTLKQIYQLIEDLFALKESDPDKFERLILSKKNAQSNLAFLPEKYADGFSSIVNQVIRVYKKAIKESNVEIAKFSIYILNEILKFLSSDKDNDLFVEEILRNSISIIDEAVDQSDSTMFYSAISLYKDIVFGFDSKFNIEYLKKFDSYYFASVKSVISHKKIELFEALISNIIDGMLPHVSDHEIWNYGHLLLEENFELYSAIQSEHRVEIKIASLNEALKSISSIKGLEGWINDFNELKTLIEPNLSGENINKAKKFEDGIVKAAHDQFKFNNLRNLFVGIGAFCLFENQTQFIKLMWNYKQPEDSVAIWIGHNIIPENLEDLMIIYFDLMESGFGPFSGHRGSEKYIRYYFLLLLCNTLKLISKDLPKNSTAIKLYRLPDLSIHKLSDLTYRCDELLVAANELKKDEKLLFDLGLGEGDVIDELFDEKVIIFINHIKEEATSQISKKHREFNTSQKKVDNYKEEVVRRFYEMATLRSIITSYIKSYKYLDKEKVSNEKFQFGININEDKAIFFDSWNVHFINAENSVAQSLAVGEDQFLFKLVVNACQEVSANNIDDLLSRFDSVNEFLILASDTNVLSFFDGSPNFHPAWKNQVEKLKVNGFEGWFKYNECMIPIFNIYNTGCKDTFLLLNKNNFGTLFQYSPLREGEGAELQKDIFYMNIMPLTERTDLLDEFSKSKPEWLVKIGNEESQNMYIQERVIIQIYEKFEFVFDKSFIGYKWIIP